MSSTEVLWTPSNDVCKNSAMGKFLNHVAVNCDPLVHDYASLHDWSVNNPDIFWSQIWEQCQVIGEKSGPALVNGHDMISAQFFPEAKVNYAENCLRHKGSTPALIFRPEIGPDATLSWDELATQVSRVQQAMIAEGIAAGDRVAALIPNCMESVIYMLAATSLGAVWSSCSPDFGDSAVLDRFSQIDPKLLITTEGYTYKGKFHAVNGKAARIANAISSIRNTIVVASPNAAAPLEQGQTLAVDWLNSFEGADLVFKRQPFNAPLFILFSSGTTGVPKCIVHSIGGTLLQHLKEHQLHSDIRDGDRLFYFSTCSWMMWNWMVSALASRVTIIQYDGSPFYPEDDRLFQMAEELEITHFGTSAKYIDYLRKAQIRVKDKFDLKAIRVILSTGSPLSGNNFRYVYDSVAENVMLASISGGTDIISCFLLGNPLLPVHVGELQCAGLGMDVQAVDEQGYTIERETGELVCKTPFPSRPIGFWNDPKNERYRKAYYVTYSSAWCQHDIICKTKTGGFEVLGRSDTTLNPGGVRIGTSEIYRVLEKLNFISEAVVVGKSTPDDVEVVLCVVLSDDITINTEIKQEIRNTIRTNCTPRHVPHFIRQVKDIPKTHNGKTAEGAVRNIINGNTVDNKDQLVNPTCLDDIVAAVSDIVSV